jgi:hypothetical protein
MRTASSIRAKCENAGTGRGGILEGVFKSRWQPSSFATDPLVSLDE